MDPRHGIALFALAIAGPTVADVTVESRFEVEAGGGLGMLASSGTSTSMIAGDRARSETRITRRSRLAGAFGGDGDSVDITRLDRGLVWQLEPAKRRYREISFDQLRAQTDEALAQLEAAQAQMGGAGGTAGLPVNAATCQWDGDGRPAIQRGETANIAGLDATRSTVTLRQTCRDPETGKACEITWTMDQWVAGSAPGGAEVQAFTERYAAALGISELVGAKAEGGAGMLLNLFGDGWEEVMAEARALEGYPVKSVMEMRVGGEACTMPSGQQIASADIFAGATVAARDAAVDQAATEAQRAMNQEIAEAAGAGIGGRIAGSAMGAFGNKLGGGLFGRNKNKTQETPPPEPATSAGPAEVVLFRVTNETTRVSSAPLAAELFDVDPGWQRVAAEGR